MNIHNALYTMVEALWIYYDLSITQMCLYHIPAQRLCFSSSSTTPVLWTSLWKLWLGLKHFHHFEDTCVSSWEMLPVHLALWNSLTQVTSCHSPPLFFRLIVTLTLSSYLFIPEQNGNSHSQSWFLCLFHKLYKFGVGTFLGYRGIPECNVRCEMSLWLG